MEVMPVAHRVSDQFNDPRVQLTFVSPHEIVWPLQHCKRNPAS